MLRKGGQAAASGKSWRYSYGVVSNTAWSRATQGRVVSYQRECHELCFPCEPQLHLHSRTVLWGVGELITVP